MIGIIDYSMGNILSVYHALEMVGASVKICQHPEDLIDVERIVLPGVGAFRDCMMNLKASGFLEILEEIVFHGSMPILGICLGMQAMADRSFEGGEHQGLGWIEGDVIELKPSDSSLRIPQMGWNDIQYRDESPLFKGLPPSPDLYFVHSFYLKCNNDADVDATCDYGGNITTAIRKDNIFATQFHPEKSQDYGLKILENFLSWNPGC